MKKLIYLALTVLIVACSSDDSSSDSNTPVITIIGDANISISQYTAYTDAGATATDNLDGDLTSSIVTTGTVNVNSIGSYTITYTVSDAAGNTATASRQVTVVDSSDVDPIIGIWTLSNEEWVGEGDWPEGQARGCYLESDEGFPDSFIFTELTVIHNVWECDEDGNLVSDNIVSGPIPYSNLGQGIYSFDEENYEVTFMSNNNVMQIDFFEDIIQTFTRD